MNLFSFDAETDGLWGAVWAIGAVVLDEQGEEVDRFAGQVELTKDTVTDEWVKANIVPLVDLPRYPLQRPLLEAFWEFWIKHAKTSLCLADFGGIVEARLFRDCVMLDWEARQWLGPYPMHELGTALLLSGVDPDVNRREFAGRPELVQHDPVDDAIAAALCWRKVTGHNE